jgi:hypothetical protein
VPAGAAAEPAGWAASTNTVQVGGQAVDKAEERISLNSHVRHRADKARSVLDRDRQSARFRDVGVP